MSPEDFPMAHRDYEHEPRLELFELLDMVSVRCLRCHEGSHHLHPKYRERTRTAGVIAEAFKQVAPVRHDGPRIPGRAPARDGHVRHGARRAA